MTKTRNQRFPQRPHHQSIILAKTNHLLVLGKSLKASTKSDRRRLILLHCLGFSLMKLKFGPITLGIMFHPQMIKQKRLPSPSTGKELRLYLLRNDRSITISQLVTGTR